jgi:transposase-like protein
LSLRLVEEMLLERGIIVSYRRARWLTHFGLNEPACAGEAGLS